MERHTFETVLGIYASEGFYRNLRSGRIYGVGPHLDTRAGEVLLMGVKRPRRGLERSELGEKYQRVARDEVRAWWEAEYAKTPATELRRFHILSGAIFPIHDRIMGSRVVLNGVPANRAELEGYGQSEEIISYKRRWFVLLDLDDAQAALPRFLAQRSPVYNVVATARHA